MTEFAAENSLPLKSEFATEIWNQMILREDPSDVSNSTELEMLCTGGSQKTPSRGNMSWGKTLNMFKIAQNFIFFVSRWVSGRLQGVI